MDKTVDIKLVEWDHTCSTGCCNRYGTKVIVDGKMLEGDFLGDDVEYSLRYVLEELGYHVKIETIQEEEL